MVHLTQVYQKPQSYEIRFLRYRVRDNFLSFWAILCPFAPSNQENQHFEKHLEMSSLYTRTKNHGHLMFSEIWSATAIINCHFAPFFPFTPRLILKVKIWKKCKEKPGYIILLHICTINYDHMMYGSWDMVRDGWRKRRTDTTNGRIEKVTKLIKFRL